VSATDTAEASPVKAWVDAKLGTTMLCTYHERFLGLVRDGLIRARRPPGGGRGRVRYALADIERLAAEATDPPAHDAG
jgi:hypothetical protein